MSGGLVQLVAYGSQDAYLTQSPQVTFWKVVYRRYTNFAIEAIEQTFNGSVDFGKRVSVTISRNGDLAYSMWMEITLKKGTGTTYYPAEALLADVELEVGGTKIDKHYSDWYRVYDELFRKSDEKVAYKRMCDWTDGEAAGNIKTFYVPLIFYFNRSPGLALPIIALQYHEIRLNFDLELAQNLIGIDTTYHPTANLYVDYVFLDVEERKRFAQTQHEYLCEQLQFTGDESAVISAGFSKSQNVRLNFNHPCKLLAWVVRGPSHGYFTGGGPGAIGEALAPVANAKLQLNGHDRFSARNGSYFNKVQPYQTIQSAPKAGVYLYSFALRPGEHQPSGTCNFSRIDNATLQLQYKSAASAASSIAAIPDELTTVAAATNLAALKVFAVNYNVFRIASGMGGLAFS